MKRNLLFVASAVALALAAAVPFAGAQQADQAPAAAPKPQPVKVRGKIAEVTNDSVTITQKDGSTKVVQLLPNLKVNALVKASMADIQKNTFVGVTAMPTDDGGMSAVEIHIFPESMRGAGEGHYPWDLAPKSTMTNAAVTQMVKDVKGSELTLTYKGGEKKVTVPADCSIVMVTDGTRDDLKKDASVFAIASQAPDGSVKTGFLLVGRGVNPPM
jgi:hypothetical protein